MWKRFVRAIKALFGGAIKAIEDPKLILEQNIRELNDQVPRMNEGIATIRANVNLVQKSLDRETAQYNDSLSKMKSAISAGRDDIASTYALKVESSQRRIAELKGELDAANRAYEKSLEVKKAFMRERERKIKEAQEAMRAHERSQWQAKVADTMQSFEVGGVAQTHDEMLSRLNEKTAINEAKMEIAVDSIDTSMLKIEEEAEKIRANDLLAKYKMEMGIGSGAQTQSQDQLRESN